MSSHARPCYQLLSQYTQNGIVPIVAPTPVETEPQMFAFYTPQKLSQKDYEHHKKHYMSIPTHDTFNSISYASYADLCPSSSEPSKNLVIREYQSQTGFNDVSTSKWY